MSEPDRNVQEEDGPDRETVSRFATTGNSGLILLFFLVMIFIVQFIHITKTIVYPSLVIWTNKLIYDTFKCVLNPSAEHRASSSSTPYAERTSPYSLGMVHPYCTRPVW